MHLPVSPGTEEANFPASPCSTAGVQEERTLLSRLLMVREVLDLSPLTALYCKDFISPEVFSGSSV